MQARRQSPGEKVGEAQVLLRTHSSTWAMVGIELLSGPGGFLALGVVSDLAMFMCYHIVEEFGGLVTRKNWWVLK